jgi:hypothetical protein
MALMSLRKAFLGAFLFVLSASYAHAQSSGGFQFGQQLSSTALNSAFAAKQDYVGTTGSGTVVRSTSPTLVTPALGVPSSVTLTNATGLPLTTGVTGTLPVANGGTGSNTATGTGSAVLATSPTIITPTITGAISGTPAAGQIGEYICAWTQSTASGCQQNNTSPISLTTATPATVASINLTAGFWLVCGRVAYPSNSTAGSVFYDAAISNAAAAIPTSYADPLNLVTYADPGNFSQPAGCKWLAVTGATTQYLTVEAFFSSGSLTAGGYIWAVRLH